jgi:hypothetical protein
LRSIQIFCFATFTRNHNFRTFATRTLSALDSQVALELS